MFNGLILIYLASAGIFHIWRWRKYPWIKWRSLSVVGGHLVFTCKHMSFHWKSVPLHANAAADRGNADHCQECSQEWTGDPGLDNHPSPSSLSEWLIQRWTCHPSKTKQSCPMRIIYIWKQRRRDPAIGFRVGHLGGQESQPAIGSCLWQQW